MRQVLLTEHGAQTRRLQEAEWESTARLPYLLQESTWTLVCYKLSLARLENICLKSPFNQD